MENMRKGDASFREDLLLRVGLNDNKAGMQGLDKEKINKIIMEASKGSRFYENELKKDQQVNKQIEKMLELKNKITDLQIMKAQLQVDKIAMELDQRRDLSCTIVHIDMDAFYAAVEMRDNPDLRDKPIAVGSLNMLSTSNYHARRYGVRAAMPGFIAKKLCPHLIIVPLNFHKYKEVSKKVREILAEYDPYFMPVGLDEAYLNITEYLEERKNWDEDKRSHLIPTSSSTLNDEQEHQQSTAPVKSIVFGISAEDVVEEIRFRIEQKTGLTASAGIAPNMMLSKMCSDQNKPNGQYRIPPEREAVMNFIRDLAIRKVPGIGKVTEKMLKALGIVTCTDLYKQRALIYLLFSETSWRNFLEISLGLGSTHLERDGERKSMSTERTFNEISATEQYTLCKELCSDLAQDLKKEGLKQTSIGILSTSSNIQLVKTVQDGVTTIAATARLNKSNALGIFLIDSQTVHQHIFRKARTVTLKLKNVNFEVKTRATTIISAVSTEEEIFAVAKDLLRLEMESVAPQPLRLRLMGVRVSGFLNEEEKKYQQKSIVNFLEPGKQASASRFFSRKSVDENLPKASESFFNKKRAISQQASQGLSLNESSKKLNVQDTTSVTFVEQAKDNECQTFICPACFKEHQGSTLEAFNQHIDKCLAGILEKDDGKMTNINIPWENATEESVERGNKECKQNNANKPGIEVQSGYAVDHVVNSSMDIVPKLQDDAHNNKNGHNISSDSVFGMHEKQDFSSKPLLVKEREYTEEPSCTDTNSSCSDSFESKTLVCPVCNLEQKTKDLALFNRHVDVCLNKGIIKELTEGSKTVGPFNRGQNKANSTVGSKRSATMAPQSTSKKPKSTNLKCTIETFFK